MSSFSPKLTPEQLIEKMKEKNIRFDLISEDDVAEYLRTNNNYFRTASYRKNYVKYQDGAKKGKYIDLDFAFLKELSTIDMHLRFLIVKMCLDIEHGLKVKLLTDITENQEEDGYKIVEDFLSKNSRIIEDIYYKRNSAYVGDLIQKCFKFDETTDDSGNKNHVIRKIECPIWAFMEIITFGEFTTFYSSYYEQYPQERNYTCLLNTVKSIRNASAHNNCIIHNLRKGASKPGALISGFVSNIPTITKSERKKALTVRPIYEMTALLFLYDKVVTEQVKTHRFSELSELIYNRMPRNKDYFSNQEIIKSSYKFLKKVVDFLVELEYNN